MDILPGVTDWSEARQRLSKFPGSQISDGQIVLRVYHSTEAEIYPSVNRAAVGRIYVIFSNDEALSTGWILARYGIPCGVSIYFNTGTFTVRYPTLLVNARLSGGGLTVRAPVLSLLFADPSFRSSTQPDLCVDNVTTGSMINRAWHGFSSAQFYALHRVAR
jgi:hypothetical protein